MKPIRNFRISGSGAYRPGSPVSSQSLEDKYGIPTGWIEKSCGVRNRYYAQGITGAEMGAQAARMALNDAGIQLQDIQLLICGSATYDYPIPNMASLIKRELDPDHVLDFPALQVNTTCLGFISAVDMASRYLDGEAVRNILVVTSEIASNGLNPSNWETVGLFGDGAAAVVLTFDKHTEGGVIRFHMNTFSEGVESTIIRGGGNRHFFREHPYNAELHSFHMDGIHLLRLARKFIPIWVNQMFSPLPLRLNDVGLIIPHQASKAGIAAFRHLYSLEESQTFDHLSENGNCISASIGMGLDDCIHSGRLKEGDLFLLCGTSAGFSIGGILLRYAK